MGAGGKGGARGSGKRHGFKQNPRGRDGTVMTRRICNSEENFAAKCPHGQGLGSGSPPPPSFPAFHAMASMSKNRPAGCLTIDLHGMGSDDSVDGPLSSILQELTTTGSDQTCGDRRESGPLVDQDPLVEARRIKYLSRERPAQRSASSWSS